MVSDGMVALVGLPVRRAAGRSCHACAWRMWRVVTAVWCPDCHPTLVYLTRAALFCALAGHFPWVEGSVNAAVTSAHRHFAQRYRHALAQHRRSLEERSILHAEVVLLFNGLEEREAAIIDCLEQQRSMLSGSSAAAANSTAAGTAGSSEAAADAGSNAAAGTAGSSRGALPDSSVAAEAGAHSRDAAAGSSAATRAGNFAGPTPSMLVAGKVNMLEIELSRLQVIHAQASKLLSKYMPTPNIGS